MPTLSLFYLRIPEICPSAERLFSLLKRLCLYRIPTSYIRAPFDRYGHTKILFAEVTTQPPLPSAKANPLEFHQELPQDQTNHHVRRLSTTLARKRSESKPKPNYTRSPLCETPPYSPLCASPRGEEPPALAAFHHWLPFTGA